MQEPIFISVILPLKLEWEPCYSLPATTDSDKISIGDRVKVKFAFKEYTGVVSAIGITPEIEKERIQSVISVETGLEHIMPEEIELWRKVAEYYMCTTGEVYKAAYPAIKVNLEEARATALEKIRTRRERMIGSMEERVRKLEEKLAAKEERLSKTKTGTKAWQNHKEGAARLKAMLDTANSALESALSRTVSNDNDKTGTPCQESRIDLTEAQSKAYMDIAGFLKTGKPVLLQGVTGSGKTEIYIKLAWDALLSGKNVLYLVPEIALSRQLEERLYLHFGDLMMTYNSSESAASRRVTAEKIRSFRNSRENRNYIVIGTRSSLFLPHHNLGLIIVDEEHDGSYKQDSPAPRYNGRDTALMLSVIHKSRIILGSATPSLEELYNCSSGKHAMVSLREKYHGAESADVEIIDTKAERRKRGMEGNFSRKLIDHIRNTLAEGEQVMILRSRRAWAPAMQCTECGEIPKCPHCNISLSYHKTQKGNEMVCHYCSYRQVFQDSCTKCNGKLRPLGAGTQRIEEEAKALFPEARIARLDSDSGHNKAYETKTIKDFAKGETDILIGTQMLTKGFDFSKLKLVAVIAADTLTGIQDFRADEKAIQILEQFRGRCGRRGSKGLLVIQTSQPTHPIYDRLRSSQPDVSGNELLKERQEFNFPPYSRILEITIRDLHEKRCQFMAERLADLLHGISGSTDDISIIGPYQPVIDRVADHHLRTVRINLKKGRMLKTNKESIRAAIRRFEKEQKYEGHIIVNVDPA